MQNWRATRPVDVARFNGRVFLTAARAYLVLFLVLLPVDVIGAMVVAHHRLPTFSTAHVLSITLPFFVTGFLSHATALLFVAMLLIAVGSLAWWRHVLAVGGPPSAALAALAAATRRAVLRLAHRVDPDTSALLARPDRTVHAAPEHPLLDQLRAALLIAPDAPPFRLAHLADRPVRLDQLISRRVA